MASKLLRRSGVEVGLVAEVLGWRADLVVQVGVGMHHEEADVLHEEWPGCRFLGFEANPDVYLAIKDYPGLVTNKAIGDETGTVWLHSKRHHLDGSSVLKLPDKDVGKTVLVTADTLDRSLRADGLWPEEGERVLLWLDCEGSELAALRGAREFCHLVDVVNVEMTMRPISPEWPSPRAIHEKLAEYGFVRQWMHSHRITAGQYDAVYVKERLFKREYCCDPW